MKPTEVLLTGATGFVGGQLVKRLQQNAEVSLRIALRSSGGQFSDSRLTVFSPVDLSINADWSVMLQGCDVVIHTAARAHIMKETAKDPLNEFRKINTEATLNLANQAAQQGVKRFIFISSIGVNGNITTGSQLFSADDLPNPSTPYAISKYEAEQGLQELAKETNMEIVIIRPPLVYGASAKGNFHRLIQWLKKGIPLPLGAINNKRSFVSLDNLLSMIITCIEHPAAANQIFLVSDGEDISTTALLKKMSQVMNQPARLVPVPQSMLSLAAYLLGRKDDLQRLCGSLQIDISKTRELLGWKPEVSIEETLRFIMEESGLDQ